MRSDSHEVKDSPAAVSAAGVDEPSTAAAATGQEDVKLLSTKLFRKIVTTASMIAQSSPPEIIDAVV
ncbi:MAG: hypothetical protein ABS976_14345, partial [Rhodococcus sp. (in: high G+C Gram-positive bacteria)]